MQISPFLALFAPKMRLNRVDFPAPFGPSKTTHSPLLISKETSFKTSLLFW